MLRRSFDHVARPYRYAEALLFGRALMHARTAQLSALPEHGRVLVLGEGDGRFLEALLAARPKLHVDVVDKSQAMLRLVHQRTSGRESQLRLVCRDARMALTDGTLSGPYDAVTTLFFLDCFAGRDLTDLIGAIGRVTTTEATWLYADFATDGAGLRGLWQRAWTQTLYAAFAALTDIEARRLEDPLPQMEREGFTLRAQQRSWAGLLRSCALVRGPKEQSRTPLPG